MTYRHCDDPRCLACGQINELESLRTVIERLKGELAEIERLTAERDKAIKHEDEIMAEMSDVREEERRGCTLIGQQQKIIESLERQISATVDQRNQAEDAYKRDESLLAWIKEAQEKALADEPEPPIFNMAEDPGEAMAKYSQWISLLRAWSREARIHMALAEAREQTALADNAALTSALNQIAQVWIKKHGSHLGPPRGSDPECIYCIAGLVLADNHPGAELLAEHEALRARLGRLEASLRECLGNLPMESPLFHEIGLTLEEKP